MALQTLVMELTTLSVEDFYLMDAFFTEVTTTTSVRSTTSEGGLLSPLLRLLFGSSVQTEVTTTIRTIQNLPTSDNLTDSLLEYELEQLLAGDSTLLARGCADETERKDVPRLLMHTA